MIFITILYYSSILTLLSYPSTISEVKKCISFIYSIDDTRQTHLRGTGFYVHVISENDPKKQTCYFVTAKHVIQDENGMFLQDIILRQNNLDGTVEYNILTPDPDLIYVHDDSDVDIAVISTTPDIKSIDFLGIPSRLILSKQTIQEIDVREGDDVFFGGLFENFQGDRKNYPIFRFGKIALITDEKIEWENTNGTVVHLNLHLLDCDVNPANSGGPVFFNFNSGREPGKRDSNEFRISLAGIVKGGIGGKMSTISAITPSYQLREILFREDVVSNRNKELSKL